MALTEQLQKLTDKSKIGSVQVKVGTIIKIDSGFWDNLNNNFRVSVQVNDENSVLVTYADVPILNPKKNIFCSSAPSPGNLAIVLFMSGNVNRSGKDGVVILDTFTTDYPSEKQNIGETGINNSTGTQKAVSNSYGTGLGSR